jgi:uncharacterized protein (TIGR02145 family)
VKNQLTNKRMKNSIWSISLNFVFLLLILPTSCKKDETISKKNPIITWTNPADISNGTALSATQLNATADVAGTFVYTPSSGTKLEVGKEQTLKVDFTPTDATNYNSISKSVKINVTAVTTVTDIDGNIYHVVTIGTQVWMVENLKVTKYNDGSAIPKVTLASDWSTQSIGAYCVYDNNEGYVATYGRLYNWFAVNSGKLAPEGWRVPTSDDWNALAVYLGGADIAGGKLKTIGSTWYTPNSGATNETGFSALPGGERLDDGSFGNKDGGDNVTYSGNFWSSTASITNGISWGYLYGRLSNDRSELQITSDFSFLNPIDYNYASGTLRCARFGKSIRCIKN